MNDITLKDAFDIYSKNRDQILTMWNFYSVATLALAVWAFGSDKAVSDFGEKVAMSYALFSFCNAWVVASSQRELGHMAKVLGDLTAHHTIAVHFRPKPIHFSLFVLFYFAFTALVVSAILQKPVKAQSAASAPVSTATATGVVKDYPASPGK